MPKKDRQHLDPVSWLFGRDLMASLKGTILYSVYGTKIDARAWMNAKECVFEDNGEPDFWFDYISDTGDSTRATYSIAYLAMSNLYVQKYFEEKPHVNDAAVTLEQKADKSKQVVLPRGQFLFVGGDTTYHLSDYPSLSNRFQNPFNWAYDDLKKDLDGKFDERRRPLFGIPGNHDYYDLLDGFQRQFRNPVRDDRKTYMADDPTSPQLRILGFERRQDASYVALLMPFNWRLWGLDTDVGKIDERQQEFFKSLIPKNSTADRLIVATSAPTTVFGQYAKKDDEKASKAFYALDLPREFLPEGDSRLEPDEARRQLLPYQCRLDIAGDIHHYARYWGNHAQYTNPQDPQDPAPREGRSEKTPETRDNYASVVSGLGGAFHHPLMTYRDEVREQVLYPSEEKSRQAVADKVFNPWAIKQGGWVWAMGLVMVFVIYFSATHVQSSRQAVSNFPLWDRLGLAAAEPITPTVPSYVPPPATGATVQSKYFWGPNSKPLETGYVESLVYMILSLPLVGGAVWLMEKQYKKFAKLEEELAGNLNKLKKDPHSGNEPSGGESGDDDVDLGDVLIRGEERVGASAKKEVVAKALNRNEVLASETSILLYVLLLGSLAVSAGGVLLMLPYRTNNTPFGNSLMVLLTIIWAIGAVILSMRFGDWLMAQTARRPVKEREWWVTGALNILAVLSVAAGLWMFGQNNLPAFLLSDIIFVITVIAAFALLMFVIPLALGASYNTSPQKARLVAFGAWHFLLQTFVAFLLVRKGTLLTLVLAGGVVMFFKYWGRYLMRKSANGISLIVSWAVYGLIMLFLPWLVFSFLTTKFARSSSLFQIAFWPRHNDAPWLESFQAYEWWRPYNAFVMNPILDNDISGWWGIAPAAVAGLVGAIMCCAWFGWYLGVSSLYNSHYNEAGGAARIEKFKQFVRIRLTPNTLTGYVIAVDYPKENGKNLEPKLIDVFQIKATEKP